MDDELIQEYLRRFNQTFSLLECSGESSIWYIELTEESLRDMQQEFADMMLHDINEDSNQFILGTLIFYGYRLGAVRLKGKNECYTRQGGYKDNAIWTYNLDEILDQDTDLDNPDAGASHIIDWATNPGSNIDVSEAVIGKMIVPMVKNLCKIVPPGKNPECLIVMPSLSKEIELIDWSAIFAGIKINNLKINIVDYGKLLNLDDDERKYIVQYQTDGFKEYVVVSAYEVIRGHNTCLGSMAFDVSDSDRQFILQDIKSTQLLIDNNQDKFEKQKKEELKTDWEYIECNYPVSNGFNSFLGNNAASFGREIYKLSNEMTDVNGECDEIRKVFSGNNALEIFEICAKLLGENNLYNVSLGDLVYVANIIQRDKSFKTVAIGTSKEYKLGTYKNFASFVDMNKIHMIPANYAFFSWKLKDKKRPVIPYFGLDAKKHNEKQIIESIVDHFEHCETATVADELLYLYKDGEDPSAFFVAKVFMYLSHIDSIEIESRNGVINSIENVDDIEYQEIDKSNIKMSKASTKNKNTIFKKQSSSINMTIEEMGFTVRTYNCLKRARIYTVAEIVKMSRNDLMKVRNLGMTCQQEVIDKIHKLGLKISGE